jgi:hypothetical protein
METLTNQQEAAPECPVCYGEVGANPTFPCGHATCSGCEERIRAMDRWGGGQKCPMCRADLPARAPPTPLVQAADARQQRLQHLANHLFTPRLQRESRRLERNLQQAQETLNAHRMLLQQRVQEWNALVGTPHAGTTIVENLQVRIPTLPLAAQLGVRVAPLPQDIPLRAAPAPAPRAAPRAARGEGQKCGHRGCQERGRDAGVRFITTADGRRLFRCPTHAQGL